MTAVMWFRRDLRLGDNPAWSAATTEHDTVKPLFVIDPVLWRSSGEHRINQLAAHLTALDRDLQDGGGRLHVVEGHPANVIPDVVGDGELFYNADHTPYARRRDATVSRAVPTTVREFDGVTFHAPGAIQNNSGEHYKVFTPYWKVWRDVPWAVWNAPGSARVTTDSGVGIPDAGESLMDGGERAARARLDDFCERVDDYKEERNRPDLDRTSRLSADLKFGTLDARRARATVGEGSPGREAWVRQLCWRDFYSQLLAHHPETVAAPLRPEYASIEWVDDATDLEAWKQGRTGYPIVDAGMRQLAAEGYVHNRVRMIVASFLVKDLLIDWRRGERHFMKWLVDGDVAQNVGNWQWVAGTGADAAPYFRIFNPVLQGKKFDPDGAYVRRYVPELREAPSEWIHEPWTAGPLELSAAGVTLGENYPLPIVDHADARERTLRAYEKAREGAGSSVA